MITIIGLKGIPLINKGDDIGSIIVQTAQKNKITIENGDVVVIAQKVVSKAEGQIVDLLKVKPSLFADVIARHMNRDPRHVEVILRESSGIVRMKNQHLIVETKHGYVCANAGVDKSNVQTENDVCLLPENPDESAERIRRRIEKLAGVRIAVVISDTFGRAWRIGHVDFAIGVAGMVPVKDYRGQSDMFGHTLRVTVMAVADELAAAAELVMNKSEGIPVAIVKSCNYPQGEGRAKDLVRPIQEDLFR